MFDINLAKIFSTVVDTKSITNAAAQLKIPKATISRKISFLEKELGVRLIHRTTRKLKVTSEGEKYYQRCHAALKAIDEANQEIISSQEDIAGEIKLTCPVLFADEFLCKLVVEFQKLFPTITIQVNATNDFIDLVEDSFDLAFRCGNENNLIGSNFVARSLGRACYCVVASPDYINQYGILSHPSQINKHKTIGHSTQWNSALQFSKKEELVTVSPKSSLNLNSIKSMCECAKEGLGITILPCYTALNALKSGELKILLPDWEFVFGELSLVYPCAKFVPKRIRLFIDFSLEYYRSSMPWVSDKIEMKKYIHEDYFCKTENNLSTQKPKLLSATRSGDNSIC